MKDKKFWLKVALVIAAIIGVDLGCQALAQRGPAYKSAEAAVRANAELLKALGPELTLIQEFAGKAKLMADPPEMSYRIGIHGSRGRGSASLVVRKGPRGWAMTQGTWQAGDKEHPL